MHVETRSFLIFQNILGTKNFQNHMNFFQVPLSTIFYKKSGTFIETLNLSLLACNNFPKNSWFLFLDKSQVQKSVDVITCFFCIAKKQKFISTQANNWNPAPQFPFPVLSFSKCLVCFMFIYTIFFIITCAS